MRRLVLLMHISLDGFVAGPDGEFNWIKVDDELFDYSGKLTDEADTALYGRVTYQMMESYWPTAADKPAATKHDREHSRWYNNVTKIVVSRTMQQENLRNTKFISDNILKEINKVKQEAGKNILLIGSPTVAYTLTQEKLIDDYRLFVNPIILGTGIPLFTGLKDTVQLKLATTKVFSSGVIGLHYERMNPAIR
jgi:dihydrofolate reductase